MTARQIVSYIAEQSGGFACIGRDGKLYIKTIGKDTTEIDIELFGDYSWGEQFTCNEVNFDNEEQSYSISDTITKGVYLDRVLDTELYSNIEGTNIEIDPNNLYIKNEQQVRNIYNQVKDLTIYGFEGNSKIDPAIDIGDIIFIEEKPIVYQGDMEYTGKFKGNISSKIETTQKKNTTVGSTLSYSTKMRLLKGQVEYTQKGLESTQEQVIEIEENKVDKNNIIQTINESNTTNTFIGRKTRSKQSVNNKTINPEKININGIESANGNFIVNENGDISCKNIEIEGGNIELEDDGTANNPSLTIRHEEENTEYISSYNSNETNYFNRKYDTDEQEYRETNNGYIEANRFSFSNEKDYYNDTTDKYETTNYSYIEGKSINDIAYLILSGGLDKTYIYNSYIQSPSFIQSSDEKKKENIKKFNYNSTNNKRAKKRTALDILADGDIYTYNFKGSKEQRLGLVLGEKYNCPNEIMINKKMNNKNSKIEKGIDLYNMCSVLWQVSKEQQELIEDLQKKIKILKKNKENIK